MARSPTAAPRSRTAWGPIRHPSPRLAPSPIQQGGTRFSPRGRGWADQTPASRLGRPMSSFTLPDRASQAQFK